MSGENKPGQLAKARGFCKQCVLAAGGSKNPGAQKEKSTLAEANTGGRVAEATDGDVDDDGHDYGGCDCDWVVVVMMVVVVAMVWRCCRNTLLTESPGFC